MRGRPPIMPVGAGPINGLPPSGVMYIAVAKMAFTAPWAITAGIQLPAFSVSHEKKIPAAIQKQHMAKIPVKGNPQ